MAQPLLIQCHTLNIQDIVMKELPTRLILPAVLAASTGFASSAALAGDSKGTLSVSFENDMFTTSNDDNYTHGTELSYVSDTYMPNWLRATSGILPFADDNDDVRMVVNFGQQIYTPRNIAEEQLIVDDRPYAGWLFLSLGLLADSASQTRIRKLEKLELIVGTVGPDSGAEDAQTWVHEQTDSTMPEGWDHQLHNEVTYDLRYQYQWMVPVINDYIDFVPQVNMMAGSSQRNIGLGMALRIGSGLRSDFGPPLIYPSASGSGYFKPDQSFYWYFYAGAYCRYVNYNIFLDGNRDGNSHSVDKRDWVGDVQAGLVVGAGNWRLALANIERTIEFESQDERDQYGSLTVSYRF